MRLTPPTKIVFYIAVALAVIGLVFYFVPAARPYAFWAELIGFVLLAAGNTVKGF